MLNGKLKYYLFFTVVFAGYLYINIPLIKNFVFLNDDLMIIFYSLKHPFPLFTFWENGLQELIPTAGVDSFRYRPFSSLIFYTTSLFFDLKPWLWALAAQLNHIINFALLIVVFKKIQQIFNFKSKIYFMLPFFYLFYPANVANVGWAAGRMDLAVIFFCLTSFYFSLLYIERKTFYYLLISSILFLTGTLTKENATCWFAVEFLLFWFIYRLRNRPPELFKFLLKIFKSKIIILIIYVFLRSIVAGISNKSVFDNFKVFSTITAFTKSLLFTFLPVDSGTFIYSLDSSTLVCGIFYSIYFCGLIAIFILIYPRKNVFISAFVFLSISGITLFYYIIAGGGTYRLFTLTFTCSLIFAFILICAKGNQSVKFNSIARFFAILVFLFFVYGFNKISHYWLVNYKVQEESLSSFLPLYDKDKKNVILNYPHSLGQASCFSDIGIYLYYKATGKIGRYNNINELAGINSHNEEHYLQGNVIEKKDNFFILTSAFNDTYFSPEPFYTQKSFAGEKFNNPKDFSFEVLKLNSFSKPLSVKLEPKDNTKDVNIIKFSNGKFEKF